MSAERREALRGDLICQGITLSCSCGQWLNSFHCPFLGRHKPAEIAAAFDVADDLAGAVPKMDAPQVGVVVIHRSGGNMLRQRAAVFGIKQRGNAAFFFDDHSGVIHGKGNRLDVLVLAGSQQAQQLFLFQIPQLLLHAAATAMGAMRHGAASKHIIGNRVILLEPVRLRPQQPDILGQRG